MARRPQPVDRRRSGLGSKEDEIPDRYQPTARYANPISSGNARGAPSPEQQSTYTSSSRGNPRAPALSPLCRQLVDQFSYGDLSGALRFINRNPEIVREDQASQIFLTEATNELQNGNRSKARNLIQKAVLVYHSAKSNVDFLRSLSRDRSAFHRMEEEEEKIFDACTQRVRTRQERQPIDQMQSRMSNMSISDEREYADRAYRHGGEFEYSQNRPSFGDRHDSSGTRRGLEDGVYPNSQHDQAVTRRTGGAHTDGLPQSPQDEAKSGWIRPRSEMRHGAVSSASHTTKQQIPVARHRHPSDGRKDQPRGSHDVNIVSFASDAREEEDEYNHHDERFRSKGARKAAQFFKVGRVFATVDVKGDEASSRRSRPDSGRGESSDEDAATARIVRFAVVKEFGVHCWAVPISAYGGQGVLKRGFTKAEQQAHAIVHMAHENPFALPRERWLLTKEPIAITPSNRESKLHRASRINFAQVQTFRHDVVHMDVGKVSDASMDNFESCFQWQQQQQRQYR